MKKKLFVMVLGLTIFLSYCNGQGSAASYNRNSISFFMISHPSDNFDTWCVNDFKELQFGDKYDINPLSENVIQASFNRDEKSLTPDQKARQIEDYLNSKSFGKEIVSYWFDRKEDGSFGRKRIEERGLYNATVNKILLANTKKRGLAEIKDEGNKLLGNSYVVVFDVHGIDKTISKSTAELTWVGFVDVYIYAIDKSELISNQDKWFYSLENSEDKYTDAEIASKKNYFDNAQFKLRHVLTTSTYVTPPVSGTLLNLFLDIANSNNKDFKAAEYKGTGESEFKSFIDRAYLQAMTAVEIKRPDFKVRTPILGVHPVTARIGLKEGLRKLQMYTVYEMALNEKNGKTEPKAVATLLASKVVNNSRNLVSDSLSRKLFSQFAVIHQYHPIEKGMFMEQKHANNLSVYADVIAGKQFIMPSVGVEVLNFMTTSGFSGSMLLDLCVASYKMGEVYNVTTTYNTYRTIYGKKYWSGSYTTTSQESDLTSHTSACFRVGYTCGFHLLTPNLRISPFAMVGYGYHASDDDSSSDDSNKGKFNEVTYSGGAKVGYNILPSWQLYLKYEYIYFMNPDYSQSGFGCGLKFSF